MLLPRWLGRVPRKMRSRRMPFGHKLMKALLVFNLERLNNLCESLLELLFQDVLLLDGQ